MENQIERFGCMPGQPLISIVIVNYNGAGWLPKCLESIKTQTIFSRIETIVVDNHSTDDSLAAARRLLVDFPMAGIVQSGENLGFCEGNNVGARAASGKYVFFLNPERVAGGGLHGTTGGGNRKGRGRGCHAVGAELSG